MTKSLKGDLEEATADCYAASEELKKDQGFFKYSHAAFIFGSQKKGRKASKQSKPVEGKNKRALEHGQSVSGQGDRVEDSDKRDDKQFSGHIAGQQLEIQSKPADGKGKRDLEHGLSATGQGDRVKDSNRTSEDYTTKVPRQSIKYDVSFKFVIDEETCFRIMESENIGLPNKSFVPISEVQKTRFSALEQLCSSHPNLLTAVHLLKLRPDMQVMMIVEPVHSFESFFKHKLREFSSKTIESKAGWWNWVKDIFRIYFRGVIRALLYLNSRKQTCGNLSFNMFATHAGHGRILPSMIADV